MKLYCDLHLHSCLSPCGDDDMTPNNIVNMAKLKGLTCIALTDHNTAMNCRATAMGSPTGRSGLYSRHGTFHCRRYSSDLPLP